MRVYEDIDANDFQGRCWGNASDTCSTLTDDQIDSVLDMLDDGFTEWEFGELNDFFSYEQDRIADMLGFDSWEKLEKINEYGEDYFDANIEVVLEHDGEDVEMESYLSDAEDESDGDYYLDDDSNEEYDEEEDVYTGYVIATVSEAVKDWLEENGITVYDKDEYMESHPTYDIDDEDEE